MSEAIWDQIAEAVIGELNTNPWRLAFTARRVEDNTLELADLDTLHVDVQPADVRLQSATDWENQYDIELDLAVRKRFAAEDQQQATGEIDQAEIDRLRGLVFDIAQFFLRRQLEGYPAVCHALQFKPHGSPAMLREQRQFTAIVKLTFRAYQ